MSWTKLSDDFADDCWSLSDGAFRLHVEALCFSNRRLLDLRIPKDDVRRFAKHPELIPELTTAEYWSDGGDVWVIRHHARYQRTRAEVIKAQETSRQNGRRGGRPKTREQVSDLKMKPSQVSAWGTDSGLETQPGNPLANPEGQDRTGQEEEGPQQHDEPLNEVLPSFDPGTGEVLDEPEPAGVCAAPGCGWSISEQRLAYGKTTCLDHADDEVRSA